MERLWLRPAHGRDKRRPSRQRPHRRGRLVSLDETLPDRRGGVRRKPRTWRKGRYYLSLFRADQLLPELFAGKRADGQRTAASWQPGQPGYWCEDAALRHFQRLRRGALPERQFPERTHSHHRDYSHGETTL